MTYSIDAWLDRPQPYLRVVNRVTGRVCMQVQGEELEALREQGVLDMSDLSNSEPSRVKELVRQLLLRCYAQTARSGITRRSSH